MVAEDLRRRFGAARVSFLLGDPTGRAVARPSTAAVAGGREAERIPPFGSVHEKVIRTRRLSQEETARGHRVIMPVTDRGDAIGVLELVLPAAPGEEVLDAVGEAAHAPAHVVIANGRFADLCAWGERFRPRPGGGDPVPAAAPGAVVPGGAVHPVREPGALRRPRRRHVRPQPGPRRSNGRRAALGGGAPLSRPREVDDRRRRRGCPLRGSACRPRLRGVTRTTGPMGVRRVGGRLRGRSTGRRRECPSWRRRR